MASRDDAATAAESGHGPGNLAISKSVAQARGMPYLVQGQLRISLDHHRAWSLLQKFTQAVMSYKVNGLTINFQRALQAFQQLQTNQRSVWRSSDVIAPQR
jgi:hypothetical protein